MSKNDGVILRPLGDNLIVETVEIKKTDGGVLLPGIARDRSREGVVLAAGPGRLDSEGARSVMDVENGDRVLVGKYSGTELKLADGSRLLILRQEDILAVIK